MDHQLVTKGNQSLELTDKELEIAQVVFLVNQLISYHLSDLQISDWARTISRLKPDITPEYLNKIIDLFIVGDIEWDTRKGIQNIFMAINKPKGYSPEEIN